MHPRKDDAPLVYFASDAERVCPTTKHSRAQGAYVESNAGVWWLRTPGYNEYSASYVYCDGSINSGGNTIFSETGTVRPAMTLILE